MEENDVKAIRVYTKAKADRFINKLVKGKGNFFLRYGTECNELIFDGSHTIFATENKNFPNNKIYLFGIVYKNVQNYVKYNQPIVFPPKKPVTKYNYKYNHDIGQLTGTDLDHAYWRIAYIKGYISKKTYQYGLDDDCKALRLACLSTLGKEKKFQKYINGMYAGDYVKKEFNDEMNRVYHDIRYSCYYMMYELSLLLGDDFDCWKTDCIFYRDTKENRKIIHDYFNERNMLFKQLVFK